MSIYGSLPAPSDDEHVDGCACYVETEPSVFEANDHDCDCGQPDAPLVYQGSHVLPSETDERGGFVDIASIAAGVRYWRDNPDATIDTEPDGLVEPFLRFGVNEGTVVLTRRHVEEIVGTLTEWLAVSSVGGNQKGDT